MAGADVRRLTRDVLRIRSAAGLDSVFGLLARAHGHVTDAQLAEAVRERDRLRAQGRDVRLGDLLLLGGALTISRYLDVMALEEEWGMRSK